MRHFSMFAFACLLLVVAPARAAEKQLPADIQAKISDAVNATLKAYGGKTPVPGAVVGIWDPKLGEMFRGFGFADLAARRSMAVADKFRIGSNTKTFIDTVILQLADEKKLSLDDTLDKFKLPVKVPNANHITLRQLGEMRSGIVDLYSSPEFQAYQFRLGDPFDVLPWVQKALDHPALFPPGKQFDYSNTNYILLGMVIEAVTHRSAASEVENRILKPHHFTNTSYPVSDAGMPDPYAHGYTLNAKGGWDDETVSLPPAATGAAGVMISDAGDMRRWVKMYVTGAVNSAAAQKDRLSCRQTPRPGVKFGFGVGCSAGWFGYTGGITGYNTSAYYLPERDVTIIAFVNSQREIKGKPDVSGAILRAIAGILYPKNLPQ
jgi:D-alanyl-D-alanine carboxypeptidase